MLLFANGFEDPELFPADGSGWSSLIIKTPPGQPDAQFEVRTDQAREGTQAGWFHAPPGAVDSACGKSSIVRRQPFAIGDTVTISASYLLDPPGTDAAPQLMDIECAPEDCGYMSSPGVRLVTTRDRRLKIDWKFLHWYSQQDPPLDPPDDAPPDSPTGTTVLPVGTWFEITVRLVLGKRDDGLTEVYIDGELELSIRGTNIAPDGMAMLTSYSGVELGITCNPTSSTSDASLYVDDVRIWGSQ